MELECKIVSHGAGFEDRQWVVEIRKPDGAPVFQALKASGDTLHVKDLDPGVYQLCISGVTGQRCESVDLTPRTGRSFLGRSKVFRFRRLLETPDTSAGSLGTRGVSVAELSVPKAALLELSRSEQAELSGKEDDSLRHLKRALALDSDYPEALNNMGVHYYRSREFGKSIECLRKATQLSPTFYAAWANLGASVLASGKFRDALDINRHALDMRPDDAAANMQMGLNFYYVRDYSQAKTYFLKAERLDPLAASSPQLFLAEIAILEKNRNDAESYLQDFLNRHPNAGVVPEIREVLAGVRAGQPVSIPAVNLSLSR